MTTIRTAYRIKKKKRYRADYRVLEKKMDDIFAVLIKLNNNMTCQRCSHEYNILPSGRIPAGLQCSHFHSRRHRNTRWSYENTKCICGGCHIYFDSHHSKYKEWLIVKGFHDKESLMWLSQKANSIFNGDRELIKIWIEQEIKKVLYKFPEIKYPFLKKEFYG